MQDKVKQLNEKETIFKFFNSIEKFRGDFKTDGFIFNPWYYNEYTILIGYSYLTEFETDYSQYYDTSKNFIIYFFLFNIILENVNIF